MTQSEFNALFKSGDAGLVWAAVQNHINQVESTANDTLTNEKQKQADLLQNIASAVRDPETPTDNAVLAILSEATKDDRQKKIDLANDEILRQEELIASLS